MFCCRFTSQNQKKSYRKEIQTTQCFLQPFEMELLRFTMPLRWTYESHQHQHKNVLPIIKCFLFCFFLLQNFFAISQPTAKAAKYCCVWMPFHPSFFFTGNVKRQASRRSANNLGIVWIACITFGFLRRVQKGLTMCLYIPFIIVFFLQWFVCIGILLKIRNFTDTRAQQTLVFFYNIIYSIRFFITSKRKSNSNLCIAYCALNCILLSVHPFRQTCQH